MTDAAEAEAPEAEPIPIPLTDRVCVAWISPGENSSWLTHSLLKMSYLEMNRRLDGLEHHFAGHFFMESGPRVASARNKIVERFLDEWEDQADWLLMLDADMRFPDTLVEDMLAALRDEDGKLIAPVVGGLYFGGGHGSIYPVAYNFCDPATNDGMAIRHLTDFKPNQMIQVDAVGTGCLLVHRAVLTWMRERFAEFKPAEWFWETLYNGVEFGEDYTFCMRVRKAGIPIYVKTGLDIGHMKAVNLTEEVWRSGLSGLKNSAPPPEAPDTPGLTAILNNRLVGPDGQPLNRAEKRRLERAR